MAKPILLSLILFLAHVASASIISADASAGVSGTVCTSSTNCTQFTDGGAQTSNPSNVQALGPYGLARASASATFGGLAIDTDANTGAPNFYTCQPSLFGFPCPFQSIPPNQYDITSSGADADASFSETITTLGGPGMANFVATLSVLFDVPDQGSVMVGGQIGNSLFTCSPGHCATTVSGQIPLNGSFVIRMTGSANTFDSAPNDPENGASGAGITISIRSITLTDAQGNPITGLDYVSDSGTASLPGQTLVPEPVTATLMGLGVVALPACRRWRKEIRA